MALIRKHIIFKLFWPDLATAHYARETSKFMAYNDWYHIRSQERESAKQVDEFKKFYLNSQRRDGIGRH